MYACYVFIMDYNFLEISSILSIPPSQRKTIHIENLLNLTKNIQFFQKLTTEQESSEIHKQCCQHMLLETYEQNSIIFHFGDKGEKFYIILKGSVSVKIPSKKKIVLSKENLNKFQSLLGSDSALGNIHENENFKNEDHRNENSIIVKVSDVFNNLANFSYKYEDENDELKHILNIEEKHLMKLFKKSLKKEKKLLLGVVKNAKGEKLEVEINEFDEIAVLSTGNSFGELSLISDTPRTATIHIIEKSTFLVLNKLDFKRILGSLAERKINVITAFMQNLPYFHE